MNRASFLIRKSWPRANARILESLSDVHTALIADALGHGFGVLDAGIRPLWHGARFVGSALPVHTAPHDILAVHAALEYAQPGDVMVVGTGPSRGGAVMGGVTAGFLRNAGV